MSNNIIINTNTNVSTIKLNYSNNFPYLSFGKLDAYKNVKHIFTTRLGGHSDGIFKSLNFAFNTGDNKENVLKNFYEVSKVFNTSIDNFYHAYQNHTSNVKIVMDEDRGKGVVKERDDGEYDAYITNCKELVIYVSVADCVPIYLYDINKNVIAIIHSGWRGTNNNIVKNTISKMKKYYNTCTKDIIACIGPSICGECYEVSQDLYNEFCKNYNNDYIKKIFKKNDKSKYNLDLWEANKMNLINEGVLVNNIDITNICTYNNPDLLFSHRRLGNKRGNMGAFIMIL